MIIVFQSKDLESLYEGRIVKGKQQYSEEVIKQFAKRIKMLSQAQSIAEIRSIKGLFFKALAGKLKGKYSVRVNDKYRIILRREKQELVIEVLVVEELSNHYK